MCRNSWRVGSTGSVLLAPLRDVRGYHLAVSRWQRSVRGDCLSRSLGSGLLAANCLPLTWTISLLRSDALERHREEVPNDLVGFFVGGERAFQREPVHALHAGQLRAHVGLL